jgi:hypothetical protein
LCYRILNFLQCLTNQIVQMKLRISLEFSCNRFPTQIELHVTCLFALVINVSFIEHSTSVHTFSTIKCTPTVLVWNTYQTTLIVLHVCKLVTTYIILELYYRMHNTVVCWHWNYEIHTWIVQIVINYSQIVSIINVWLSRTVKW